MWGLLALIGLITILYLTSKLLVRFGNFCTRLSEAMGDYSVIVQKKSTPPNTERNKDITDKIRAIKGDEPDYEYTQKVRQEIDELTDPEA